MQQKRSARAEQRGRLSQPHRAEGGKPRRARKRRRRLAAIAAVILVALLVPPTISYAAYMAKASSVPWSIRSVEWVRENHGAWLVNSVERLYYTWTAPKKGGPGLRALPSVAGAAPLRTRPSSRARSYDPVNVTPAVTPALANEGVWRPVGRALRGEHPLMVTVFRNERDYPQLVTYAAWIDHTLTQLALYPGRTQPPQGAPRGPMMVPPGQRGRLLATFNSGFTYNDGHGGFALNGRVYMPLRAGFGTLLGYSDGRLDIVSWPGGAPAANVVLARQNLPLIVDGGQPNPTLNTNDTRWGSTLGESIRVWRSGVGVDAHGNLVYVAAPKQTVVSLATALVRVGAVRALELDINSYWPTFNYYRQAGGRAPVKFLPDSALLPGLTRYLVPDDRDFFAVYARDKSGGFTTPFK